MNEIDNLPIKIRRGEARLIGQLLKSAGDTFGNHGCNDFDLLAVFDGDTEAARYFAIGYHAWNVNKTRDTLCIGERYEAHFDPDMYDVFEADLLNIPDSGLFAYLGAMFESLAEMNQ